MSERIKLILIGVMMLMMLTFLLIKTNAIDSSDHLRYSGDLRLLKELDAMVDTQLLELRFGKIETDGPVKETISRLAAASTDMRNLPTFLDSREAAVLSGVLKEYEILQAEQTSAIGRFSENNIKITKALKEFKAIVSEFSSDAPGGAELKRHSKVAGQLSNSVLEYYVSSSGDLKTDLEKSVISFKSAKDSESSPSAIKKFDSVLVSARSILEAKPERDRLVNYILTIETGPKVNKIIEFYQAKHFEAANTAGTYRSVLYGLTIFLLAYVSFVVIKLKKTSLELNLVNENLEGRVDDRTNALSLSNIELQASESKNKALLGALPDTMWRINGAGVFLDVISAEDDDQHVTSSGWEGKTIYDLLPEKIADDLLTKTSKALETGERQKFEFELVKNNRNQFFESRIVVCGSFEVLIVVRDTTDLNQALAESHLNAEINEIANATSSLKDLLARIHNSIKSVIYAENCFVALYDKANEGLDLQLFVDQHDEEPESLRMGKGLTAYVIRTGKAALLTKAMIEHLADIGEIEIVGTPPAVWVGIPLRTSDEIIGALVVQHYEDQNVYGERDIELLESIGDQIAISILRKRAEDALKVSELRFQQAFDFAPIGICLLSPNGNFLQVNHALCKMLGYAKEELLTLSILDITEADDLAVSIENQQKMLSGAMDSFQLEKRLVNKAGDPVLVLTSVSLVRDFKGAPVYFIGQIQDVSERKSMEDQLQRAMKLESIGQLAAGIAHEINTPTQYVGDNTRFLSDSFEGFFTVLEKNKELIEACKSGPVSAELIEEVEKAIEDADIEYLSEEIPLAIKQALHGVERISKIVQSMKEFAHPGSHDKKAADLNKAIESTITVASNEWKYVADLETNFDENLPALPCLVGEFNQVILNMIINASHAISDVVGDGSNGKGTITISTTKAGEWAEIRIGDTGSGMPEDVRKKIFDPFFTTKEVGKGTGQGLAISHNVIVEKHNGTIEVESEVGKGTTFVIKLPMNDLSMPA